MPLSVEDYVKQSLQQSSGELEGQPSLDSLVESGAVAQGDHQKGFWENTGDAAGSALRKAGSAVWGLWQTIGQTGQEYKRQWEFLTNKTTKGGDWDPTGDKTISDSFLVLTGMVAPTKMWPEEAYKEYVKYMEENPLDLNKQDSWTDKIFNRPVEATRAEMKYHYWLNPDDTPEQPDSFIDAIMNPRKMAASVIDTGPMIAGSMGARILKSAPLANTIIFAFEYNDAYEGALEYLNQNDVANGFMGPEEAQKQARDHALIYATAATAIESWQQKNWMKLGTNLKKGTTNLMAGKMAKEGFKHTGKSFTVDWFDNLLFQVLQENTQGTTQEMLAKFQFGQPVEGGVKGFMNRRGIEAATMIGLMGPSLPGSVSIDLVNGPVQRNDATLKRDIKAMGDSVEHFKKKAEREGRSSTEFMDHEDFHVPEIISRYQVSLEKIIEKVFGKKVVWFTGKPSKGDGPSRADLFDGLAHPTDSGTILMNTNGQRSLQNVGLHEALHQMRRDDEGEYTKLKSAVLGFLRSGEYMKAELKRFGQATKNMNDDQITEEMVAEILGRLADEPAFMDQLADRDPTLLVKFGRQAGKAFERTLRAIKGRKGRRLDAKRRWWVDPYITDMETLMTKVLTVLKNKAVREEGNAALEEAATEVADAVTEAREITEGKLPEAKPQEKVEAKPPEKTEPSAQEAPTQAIAERPAREITQKTADELYMDYIEATKNPDMTPEIQKRLRDMVSERGRIERGEVADVGLSAEEVSQEIDKFRPQARQQRTQAAQEALKEGKGTVGPPAGRTKAEQAVERRKARAVKAMAKRKPLLSIVNAIKGALVDAANQGLADNTILQRHMVYKLLDDFLKANNIVDVNDVTADVARTFARGLSRGGLKASTVNQYVRVLKHMWGDMVERGQVANNPFDEVEIAKEAKPKPRLVSRETVDKVVSMIPKGAANRLRDIALIKVLFTSGMRASEVAGVGQKDLSTTAGAADVTGKGQKQRRVRFSPSAAKAVDDYVNKERSQLPDAPYQPYLFLSARGTPLSRVTVRNIIKKHFKAAGVKLTAHDLRHSFAVDMLEHGVSLPALQQLLGHDNINTTARYLHLSMKHLRAAIDKLPTEGRGIQPALRRLTPTEKKAGLDTPVNRRGWIEMLSMPLIRSTNLRKGWISKAGDVYRVIVKGGPTPASSVWEHHSQLKRAGVRVTSALRGGMVRVASFNHARGNVDTIFEVIKDGLNPSNLSTMKEMAAEFAVDGKTNIVSIEMVGTGFGRIEFFRKSQAARAVDQAIDMAQGTLTPALNREAYKKWKAHQVRSNENYRRAQERKRKALKKEQNALRRKIRKAERESERAYKAGIRDAKKKLSEFIKQGVEWRKEFADYVNKNLPANVRGKLNKVLAEIKTEKNQQKAIKRLIKEIDRLEKAEALGRLKRWISRFGKDYGFHRKQGYKKGMRFKISTPLSSAIESILDSIILKTPRDPASLADLLDYAKDELAAAEEADRAQGVDKENSTNPYIRFEIVPLIERLEKKLNAQNVKEWTAAEIDELLETLDVILGEWKYKRSEKAKQELEEFEQDKTESLSEIKSGHKKPMSKEKADEAYEKGLSRYTTRFFWKGLFGRFNYNIQTLVRIMGGMNEGALYATLVNDLFMGRDNEKSHVFQAMDLFQRRWKEVGITEEEMMSFSKYGSVRKQLMSKKMEAWFEEAMPGFIKKRAQFIQTKDIEVKLASGQTLRMTVAEALSLLMHTNNEYSYNAIKKSGIVTRRDVLNRREIKDEDFDTIRSALPEKALRLLPIFAEVMSFQQDEINEVSERMYGYGIANVDGYWHIRRFRMKGVRGKKGEATKQTIESRSHFKERIGGADPVYIDDAFNEMVDTVRVGAEFVGLAEPMQAIRKMTNDPDIQRAILERGYGEYFKDYVDQIDSIQEHNVGLDWWEKLYGAWARNITRSVFGLNPRIAAQQYASVMLATSELGLNHLKAVRGKYDSVLKSRMEKYSPMLRERFMGAITRELGDVSKTGGVMRFITGRDQLLNVPTFMVRVFDMLAVMDVWRMSESWAYENYKRYRVKYHEGQKPVSLKQLLHEADTLTREQRVALDKKRGSNTADFIDMVVQKAEGTIRISQPTWDIVDRSRIGSVRNPMVKALTMFHSQREKMAQMIGIANSTYMNELEQIRRENGLENLKAAAATKEGIRAFRKMARVWGTILFNTTLVKSWGALYGAAVMGRPEEPEKILTNVVADIPGMYYFGDTARGVVSSLGKRLQGEKTYQLGAYQPPPLRVVTDATIAAYEMGVLTMLTTGIERPKRGDVEKQLTKTLDRTWDSMNSMLGLPFQHPTDVAAAQIKRQQPKKRKKGRR